MIYRQWIVQICLPAKKAYRHSRGGGIVDCLNRIEQGGDPDSQVASRLRIDVAQVLLLLDLNRLDPNVSNKTEQLNRLIQLSDAQMLGLWNAFRRSSPVEIVAYFLGLANFQRGLAAAGEVPKDPAPGTFVEKNGI